MTGTAGVVAVLALMLAAMLSGSAMFAMFARTAMPAATHAVAMHPVIAAVIIPPAKAQQVAVHVELRAQILAIGILAEDIGGSLALLLASEDPGVQSLAWIEPGLQYRKLNVREAASSIRDRPLLYVATTGDRYARHSAQALARLSERGEARILEGSSSHEASAMGAHPDIAENIRAWLADTLSAAPARR